MRPLAHNTVTPAKSPKLLVPPPPSAVSVAVLERLITKDPFGVARNAPVGALGKIQLERLAAEYDSRGSHEVKRVYANALKALLSQQPHATVRRWLTAEQAAR